MTDLVILGTDTDAGKTTFSLLWLTAFSDWEYFKPLETGTSDSETIRSLIPKAKIHAPIQRFEMPVAPLLAARREGKTIPPAQDIARGRPHVKKPLLIETFGSPFSPLNEEELQIDLIDLWQGRRILITSSRIGAVGRTVQTLEALAGRGLPAAAVVLIGPEDSFAAEQIGRHGSKVPVFSLPPPGDDGEPWTTDLLEKTVLKHRSTLEALRDHLLECPIPQAEISARDHKSVWHPYTSLRSSEAPLVCVGAKNEFLHLADGRRLIDAISSWWTIQHGHRPAFLMEALARASREIDHVLFAGVTHPWAVELAELLLASTPLADGRVFYSDNGSTAVEVALKLAYQYWCHRGEPARTRFVGFENSYHGDTFGAMAVSRDPIFFGRFEPLLFQADILPVDPQALRDHLARNAERIAGVILEPLVQGAGGMLMHSPKVLRAIVETTQQHQIPFIADEVMTGGGRTGTFWAHSQAEVVPDLICTAKTLAGGILPLAATLVSPRLVQAFDNPDRRSTFFHGHSFTAHPLACAVAVANLKKMTDNFPTAPRQMEAFWNRRLIPLRSQPRVKEVRIRGTIAAIELDVPGGYLAESAARMREIALEQGVFLRPLGSVLYALPPFCCSEESLEKIATAMESAVMGF